MEGKAPNLKMRDDEGTAEKAMLTCFGVLAYAAMTNAELLRMTEDEAESMARWLL